MLNISDLDTTDVAQAELILVEFLQTEYPSLDLSKGTVLRDTVIRPAALSYALNAENMDRLRRSFSLQQIVSDPTLANDDIVDGVLSNLLITRDDGDYASGQLRIIISELVTTSIDNDALFYANGITYRPTRGFVGVTSSSNVVNLGSRLISSRSDGNYEFIIDVQSVSASTAANASEGTRFTVSTTINRLIDVVAAGDFSGGRAPEDNASLASRAQAGLSPKVLSGRSHIEALLREQLTDLSAVSIIGYGDVEMQRDQHNLFRISHGGKVNIYARTAATPIREVVEATATMIDTSSDQKLLSVAMDRDTMAGVYDVLAIYREGEVPFQLSSESEPSFADSLEITSKVWSFNVTSSDGEFVPDITSLQEAAFTRYRTMSLRFKDPESTLGLNETGTYQIYLLKMPNIAEAQDIINSRSVRSPGSDHLVCAPIPAICSVGIVVNARDTGDIDADAIKVAVANRINDLGFTIGYLPAAVIIDAAQGQLPSDATLDLPLSMQGTIYLPNDTTVVVTATDELRIPSTVADNVVSSRTVAWFLRVSDIDVSVKDLSTPEA